MLIIISFHHPQRQLERCVSPRRTPLAVRSKTPGSQKTPRRSNTRVTWFKEGGTDKKDAEKGNRV
jgi:hypothetical protein